jgi:hypothetical protein
MTVARPDAVDTGTGAEIEAYPRLFSLADILTEWNPDDVNIPADYSKHNTLRYFDYSVSRVWYPSRVGFNSAMPHCLPTGRS